MHLIDCEASIAPWGTKAKFKKAKLGLVKKNPTNSLTSPIYLIVNFATNNMNKLLINPKDIQLLPAAIRFNDLSRDVFIRAPNEDTKLKQMLRKLRIIVEQDKLRRKGKGTTVDETLLNIPSVDYVIGNSKELMPTRTSAKIVATSDSEPNNKGDSKIRATKTAASRLENRQLKTIDVEGISELPANLFLRDTLCELNLVRCNLKSIPHQLHQFGNSLVILNLSHNLITDVPAQFCCSMTKLSRLDLSNNSLKRLPLEVRFLNQLISLNLSKNQLTTLPSTFTDLTKLRYLILANNELKLLPPFHHREVKLQRLDISHNPLDDMSNSQEYPSKFVIDDSLYSAKLASLTELATLKVVRSDHLFKVAHKMLPPVLYSHLQHDIFKCFECNELNFVPSFDIIDHLDYVSQVEALQTSNNLNGMTFVKSICRVCITTKY